jgi:hypothetical protein
MVLAFTTRISFRLRRRRFAKGAPLMHAHVRRSLVVSIHLFCFASLGCVQLPFYVPTMNVVPPVKSGCESADVHAFRVDITDVVELKDGPPPECTFSGSNREIYELSRIPLAAGGAVPKQVGMSVDHGWCYVGFFNLVNTWTSHSVAIRMYRPGFETIELKAGQTLHALEWIEAPDLAAQEKAVDDLLGVAILDRASTKSAKQDIRLEPGTKSSAHRDALLFAAREYERLAKTLSADDVGAPDVNARLREKAQRVRALANGKAL